MKKIIVAICGIMIVSGVFAYYDTPKLNNKYYSDWKVNEGAYDTGLEKTYSHLITQYGQEDENGDHASVKAGDGTRSDEKAIVIDMARNIYKNGAKFCTTQVQAGNINARDYTWLDYYKTQAEIDDKLVCKTICKPGYDPEKNCDEKIVGCKLDKTDNTGFFYDYNVVGSGGASNRIDDETEVFSFLNETGMGASNQPAGNRLTRHVVLAIVKKLKNGAIVAPVQIEGKRDKKSFVGFGIQSWVRSAKYSSDNVTLLCNVGYVANTSNTDCVQDASCATNYPMCDGYAENGYDEKVHILKTKRIPSVGFNGGHIILSETCTYFECKPDYALDDNGQCIECPNSRNQGVKNNVCIKCGAKKFFDKNASNGCRDARPITLKELVHGITSTAECWMESSPLKYKDCVLDCGNGEHWNDSTKQCEQFIYHELKPHL